MKLNEATANGERYRGRKPTRAYTSTHVSWRICAGVQRQSIRSIFYMVNVLLNKCEPFISYGFRTTNVTHNNDQYPFSKEHLRHSVRRDVVCTLATVKAIHNATKGKRTRREAKRKNNIYNSHTTDDNYTCSLLSIKLCMCQVYTSYPYRTITIATATTTSVRRAIPLSQIQWFSTCCSLARSLVHSFSICVALDGFSILFVLETLYLLARFCFFLVASSIGAQAGCCFLSRLNSCACLKTA